MLPATYRASLFYLLRHPWQLLLAILGISVGVAVIVAVDIANSSARKAFLLSMDTLTGQATHQVIGGPRGVSEDVYRQLRVDQGIEAVAPIVETTASIGEARFTVLGIDVFAERTFREFSTEARTADTEDKDPGALITRLLTTPGGVLLSQSTAEELGLAAGEYFDVIVDGQFHEAKLLATFGNDDGAGRLLLTDIATAQEWSGSYGVLTRIDVRISDDAGVTLADVEDALPAGTRLLSAAGRTRSTLEMSTAFMTNLAAMSLLALLVGLFLIFNSVNFSVLQRRNLIGVLRALGLTRRQLLLIILAEAGFLGLVAAALGVVLGLVLGEQLVGLVARTIDDLYFRLRVTSIDINTLTLLKGMLAGVGAAMIAAALPAWEATTYEPRLAMARSTLEHKANRMLPVLSFAGVGLMTGAVGLIACTNTSLVAGLVAVFLAILGFALCVPLFVRFAARIAAPAAAAAGGTTARMAIAGIASGLSRTGIAIVALTIAVSATIGVSIMVDSFRGSVSTWLQQSLQADIYVGTQKSVMAPELVSTISALDGVIDGSTRRLTSVESEDRRTQLRVFELPTASYAGFELLDNSPEQVWPAWEKTDAVLVTEPYAYRFDVRAGDRIPLPTDHGVQQFLVAATFQSYDVDADSVVMHRTTYLRHYDDDSIDGLGLYLADGVSADEVVAKIESLGANWPGLYAASNAQLRSESLQVFDRTFVITDILYWLTLGVAFIGILSAMLALQLERARESATLRALGMTPAQVGGVITVQTGAVGVLSGVAAVPLGIVMAWILIKVINRRAFGWQIDMSINPGILLTTVAFAVAAALLAGLYPAYRAGRVQPAVAMREE